MERLQKTLFWALVASETSHVFCCVLPTLFSVLSLLAGLGVVSVLPAPILEFHEMMHDWEIPVISMSGAILLFGWAIDSYARKIDCHNTGCAHGPCTPKKKRADKILKIATVLFLVNVSVYLIFHRSMDSHSDHPVETIADEHHH